LRIHSRAQTYAIHARSLCRCRPHGSLPRCAAQN
jgi:hypothetical protein